MEGVAGDGPARRVNYRVSWCRSQWVVSPLAFYVYDGDTKGWNFTWSRFIFLLIIKLCFGLLREMLQATKRSLLCAGLSRLFYVETVHVSNMVSLVMVCFWSSCTYNQIIDGGRSVTYMLYCFANVQSFKVFIKMISFPWIFILSSDI